MKINGFYKCKFYFLEKQIDMNKAATFHTIDYLHYVNSKILFLLII